MQGEKIRLPYGNAAAKFAVGIIQEIAEQMWERGQKETAAYIAAAIPGGKTTDERYESGRYYRTVKRRGGRRVTIAYDYSAKAILIITNEEANECKRQSTPIPQSVCGAVGGFAVSEA